MFIGGIKLLKLRIFFDVLSELAFPFFKHCMLVRLQRLSFPLCSFMQVFNGDAVDRIDSGSIGVTNITTMLEAPLKF